MSARGCPTGGRTRERGIALVLVLWLTVLLTVIAGTFAFDMRVEALGARNAVSLAQARAIADGAIVRFAYELGRPRPRPEDVWKNDGNPHRWSDGDSQVVAWGVDESSRVDLNAAPDAMLLTLFVNVGGVDGPTAAALVDAILDWRDPDDLRRPNGAEEADYRAADLKHKPANAPFDSVADLARVRGMTPQIYARVAPVLTVYSRVAGVNVYTASREALLAIPNVTPEQVDEYLRQREAARAANLSIPRFPWAQNYAAAPTAVTRIRAEASMPDGVTFAREAVVRTSADPRRPMVVFAWTDAPRAPLAPTDDAPAAAQSPIPPADAARS